MELVTVLSRIQFALTAGFHIIFPALLIGLSVFLSILYWRWLKTSDESYLSSYNIWLRVLLVIYIVAAITGVALSAQLDNIFGGFYEKVESALVPFRHYELIFATLLEGGCIGVMLLCTKQRRSYSRFAATLLFTFGIFLTAFFVVSRNSWMNTPDGFTMENGEIFVYDYMAVLFNPSFPLRYLHMITAGLLSTSFFVLGMSAWRLLRNPTDRLASISLNIGLTAGIVLSIAQFIIGDLHGLDVYKHQPMKIAAIEGQWETERGADFKIFAVPDMKNERNDYEISIPNALSLVLEHDSNAEIRGLKELPPQSRPNVPVSFYSFRIMVAMGMVMLITSIIGIILRRRKVLESKQWFLRLAMLVSPAGLIAVIAGWFAAEVGRQPWTIYNMVRTSEVMTVNSGEQVITSLLVFSVGYTLLAIASVYCIRRIVLFNENMYCGFTR